MKKICVAVVAALALLHVESSAVLPQSGMSGSEVHADTGEGLPDPNPTRIGNWATLPTAMTS